MCQRVANSNLHWGNAKIFGFSHLLPQVREELCSDCSTSLSPIREKEDMDVLWRIWGGLWYSQEKANLCPYPSLSRFHGAIYSDADASSCGLGAVQVAAFASRTLAKMSVTTVQLEVKCLPWSGQYVTFVPIYSSQYIPIKILSNGYRVSETPKASQHGGSKYLQNTNSLKKGWKKLQWKQLSWPLKLSGKTIALNLELGTCMVIRGTAHIATSRPQSMPCYPVVYQWYNTSCIPHEGSHALQMLWTQQQQLLQKKQYLLSQIGRCSWKRPSPPFAIDSAYSVGTSFWGRINCKWCCFGCTT